MTTRFSRSVAILTLGLASTIVAQGKPDLRVTASSIKLIEGTRIMQGGALLEVTTTTTNDAKATATSPASYVSFVLDCCRPQRRSYYIGGHAAPALAPDKSFTTTIRVRMPWHYGATSQGPRTGLYAFVDQAGVVSELNEGNNTRMMRYGDRWAYKGPGRFLTYAGSVYLDKNGPFEPTKTVFDLRTGGTARFIVTAPSWKNGHWVLTVWSRSPKPFQFDDLTAFTLSIINNPVGIARFFPMRVLNSLSFPVTLPALPGIKFEAWLHTLWFAPDFSSFKGFGDNSILMRFDS